MNTIQIDYLRKELKLYPEVFELLDLGNFIIRGHGESGTTYLVIRTENGYSRVINIDPSKKITFKFMEFNDTKVYNLIRNYLSIQEHVECLPVDEYNKLIEDIITNDLLIFPKEEQ